MGISEYGPRKEYSFCFFAIILTNILTCLQCASGTIVVKQLQLYSKYTTQKAPATAKFRILANVEEIVLIVDIKNMDVDLTKFQNLSYLYFC